MQTVIVGDKVSVSSKGKRMTTNKVKGRVIYKNDHFFVVYVEKHGVPIYKESFMFKEKLEIHKH
jgi:hypothetical protein